jgi:hypothetical protein
MPRALPPLRSLALRFALVGLLVLGIGTRFADALIEPLLPALGRGVDALSADVTISEVSLDRKAAPPAAVFRTNLSRITLIGGNFIYPLGEDGGPDGWYQVTLTTGGILQHALFLLLIVLAWPAQPSTLAWRMVLALPLAGALLLQHVGVTVLAEIWFPVHDELAPDQIWPLLAWSRFLMGGGGLVLAMVLGALVIGAADRLDQVLHRVLPCGAKSRVRRRRAAAMPMAAGVRRPGHRVRT